MARTQRATDAKFPRVGVERLRVLYADTDAMGVVYHANYFKWFELGRCELMRGLGITYKYFEEQGFMLPVVEAQAHYHQPARYDDELTIETRAIEVRRASLRFGYAIKRGAEVLAEGMTLHACTTRDGKVVRFPDFLVKAAEAAQIGGGRES